jgi:hypothetical protein
MHSAKHWLGRVQDGFNSTHTSSVYNIDEIDVIDRHTSGMHVLPLHDLTMPNSERLNSDHISSVQHLITL